MIKSGVEALDEMFGGGQESGTITLVIGQSGTGKSTMSSLYATAALQRGESVALFLFEERVETFFRRSEGLGMDLRQFHRMAIWSSMILARTKSRPVSSVKSCSRPLKRTRRASS